MKHNRFHTILPCVAALSLAWFPYGCSDTEEAGEGGAPGRVRAVTENSSPLLSDGSAVGLYMVEGGKGINGQRIFDNAKLVRSGGGFIAEPALFYPEGAQPAYDFYAYAPYRSGAVASGASFITLNVQPDQSDRKAYEASDFLLAHTLGHKPSQGTVNLNFAHPLARVDIVLKAGGSYESAADIPSPRTVTIAGAATEGRLDFGTGFFTSVGQTADITPFGTFAERGDVLDGVSAIVIPQTVKAGQEFLKVSAGKDNYAYAPEADLTFEAGKVHTVTLTLNASFGNVTITMEAEVNDWADGGDTPVEGGEVLPPEGNAVQDADGNSYPIVRIGGRYWMGANLRTSKYNDGTPIPEITDAKAWLETGGGARCSYDNDPDNYARYGALYNRKAVNTRKLCPPGWHVPDGTEWDQLAAALGGTVDDYQAWHGVGSALKATTGWAEGENGTNESGFGALPGGYRYADTEYQGYSSFQNGGVYPCWWSMTEVSSYMSYARSVQGDMLYRYLRSNESGCSVRCIHDF